MRSMRSMRGGFIAMFFLQKVKSDNQKGKRESEYRPQPL